MIVKVLIEQNHHIIDVVIDPIDHHDQLAHVLEIIEIIQLLLRMEQFGILILHHHLIHLQKQLEQAIIIMQSDRVLIST